MHDFGLGLKPITQAEHEWLDAVCVEFPASCCAVGDVPLSYHPPLTKKNQGRTNTCAGHAFSTGRELLNYQKTGTIEVYSALFSYLVAKRRYDGTYNDDGTSISSLFAGGLEDGTPREETAPFQGRVDPRALTQRAIEEARQHRTGQFVRLRSYQDCFRFMSSNVGGFIVIGAPWYDGLTVQSLGTNRETCAGYTGRFLGFHARTFTGWFSPEEMSRYCRDFDPSRPDLEIWNSHADGPRPITADAVDMICNDPRCEVIGCMDQTEFAPKKFVDWSQTECLVA